MGQDLAIEISTTPSVTRDTDWEVSPVTLPHTITTKQETDKSSSVKPKADITIPHQPIDTALSNVYCI